MYQLGHDKERAPAAFLLRFQNVTVDVIAHIEQILPTRTDQLTKLLAVPYQGGVTWCHHYTLTLANIILGGRGTPGEGLRGLRAGGPGGRAPSTQEMFSKKF